MKKEVRKLEPEQKELFEKEYEKTGNAPLVIGEDIKEKLPDRGNSIEWMHILHSANRGDEWFFLRFKPANAARGEQRDIRERTFKEGEPVNCDSIHNKGCLVVEKGVITFYKKRLS